MKHKQTMQRLIPLTYILLLTWAGSASAQIRWHSADTLPLLGKAADQSSTTLRYQRLPDSLEHQVKRPALYANGRHSSGMALRFASDAPDIHIRWKSVMNTIMNIMTPTATRGLDLYTMMPDSSWTFVNTARPDLYNATTETLVTGNMDAVKREYMLYLSLYDCVDSLYIGTPEGYTVSQPGISLPRASRPIVYYGTSLVHGGCVNRAGMSHTNQLRRRLNRDIINLGFGGNGQLDLEIAHVIAATPDPSLVILDFVPNCSSGQIDTLMIPFTEIIREAHPEVPILFVECPDHPRNRFDNVMRQATARHNAIMHRRYDDLISRGMKGLHLLPAKGLLGDDNEHTVDALHMTDLGSKRFADSLEPVLRALIAE